MQTIPEAILPTANKSAEFVVEHVYHNASFGIHVADIERSMIEVWDDETRRQEIYNHCPELKMVMTPMKLMREKCEPEALEGEP